MRKKKGPDMLQLPEENWRESTWLPSGNLLERYAWASLFGNDHPVEVELGAGDGGFILAWAARHPDRNFIALERLLGRCRKIAKRSAEQGMVNLKALRLESAYFIRHLCPPESVSRIHIMFPDPWPKKKHHKHRLIQPAFLEDTLRVLVPGGALRFTTDHTDYFAWAQGVWEQSPGWHNAGSWDATDDPRTDFEKTFLAEGREFHRVEWVKKLPEKL